MFLITVDSNVLGLSQKIVESVTSIDLLDVPDLDACTKSNDKHSKKPIVSEALCKKNDNDTHVSHSKLNKFYSIGYAWCSEDVCIPITMLCSKIKTKYQSSDILLYNTPMTQSNAIVSTALQSLKEATPIYTHLSFVYLDFKNKNKIFYSLLGNLINYPAIVIVDRASITDINIVSSIKCRYKIILTKHNCNVTQIEIFVSFVIKCWQKYGNLPNLSLGTCNAFNAAKRGIFAKDKGDLYLNIYDFVEKKCSIRRPIRDCVKYSCKSGL